MLVLRGGSVSLAVLRVGQDAAGEIHMMGNVFGVPFGNSGVVIKLVPAPEADAPHDGDELIGRRHWRALPGLQHRRPARPSARRRERVHGGLPAEETGHVDSFPNVRFPCRRRWRP